MDEFIFYFIFFANLIYVPLRIVIVWNLRPNNYMTAEIFVNLTAGYILSRTLHQNNYEFIKDD